MPTVRHRLRVPLPRPAVFAYFRRPAHAVALAPPGAGLTLLEAPEVVAVGSRIVVQARRWGLSRRFVAEVVELAEPDRIVEEQREGPFARWRHSRSFEAAGGETDLVEEVTFDPPGGMLGLTLTAAAVERDLEAAFAWRDARLAESIRAWRPTPAPAAPAAPR
jgi:ligand-binding SRPBCC domain-containing protein